MTPEFDCPTHPLDILSHVFINFLTAVTALYYLSSDSMETQKCHLTDDCAGDSRLWAVTYSGFDEQGMSVAIRYSCILLYVKVSADDLADWQRKQ